MRKIPTTPKKWLDEIRLAVSDASEAKPFAVQTGHPITDANLFHLAPLVALKFRGRNGRPYKPKENLFNLTPKKQISL